MKELPIERIESRKIEKARKIFLICGIVSIILLPIKLTTATNIQKVSLGYWIDLILISGIPIYYLFLRQTMFKNRTGQFIEWQSDKILYKLKDDTVLTEIDLQSIKSIEIRLDIIIIKDINNQEFDLDIADFDKYEKRKRIKENFEKIKNCI